MKITQLGITVLFTASLLVGCSHTTKVATKKPTDARLSCTEIQQEFDDLDKVMRQAKKNKGASGKNIAAALLFWPAAVGNYIDAENAEELVKERQENLVSLSEKKGC